MRARATEESRQRTIKGGAIVIPDVLSLSVAASDGDAPMSARGSLPPSASTTTKTTFPGTPGPPYAVAECVFDEDDKEGCVPNVKG
jgi:hypothetical protein